MGEKAGSLDENNARVLRETRFRSASVGDESATIGMYQNTALATDVNMTH